MMILTADELINSYRAKLDARFDILLNDGDFSYKKVIEAAKYSLMNGGKRIRPILLLEFYRLCGKNDDLAYNFACALEMIHTYSLIHDDLPCMDNDDMRRGMPSCHKKYGESMALLAGDALLTEAFNVASKTMGIAPEYVLESLNFLASESGVVGMIGGQTVDIENDGFDSLDSLFEMYEMKTSALIQIACVCGVTLAGADDVTKRAASEYGKNLGIAFQIIDDILDCVGTEEMLGKPVGSDVKNGKKTVVAVVGLEKAKEIADMYTKKATDALLSIDGDTENLLKITEFLLNRSY